MTDQERLLREALLRLVNEASGFLSMADQYSHGVTNMKVLQLRIDEAQAALAAPTGSTPQRPVHNALTLLMEALNDPHYQQESTEMAREAMQMAKDEIERLNAIVAAEARASVLGADLPVIEMRLCEIPHLMLRPNQLYRFTVDHDCKGCADASAPVERPAVAEGTIEDGFGSTWSKRCPMCNQLTMQIVRPGKVQCSECG